MREVWRSAPDNVNTPAFVWAAASSSMTNGGLDRNPVPKPSEGSKCFSASTTALITVLQLIGSLRVFEQIYLMTSGGPNFAS